MSATPSTLSTVAERAYVALEEIRACDTELQRFLAGLFDRLDEFLDEVRTEQFARAETRRHAERETLNAEIDRLSALVNQLTDSLDEQRQMAAGLKRR